MQRGEDTASRTERVDAVTWNGFSTWLAAALNEADDTFVQAQTTSNMLTPPHQERLRRLLGEAEGLYLVLTNGEEALAQGDPAPRLTANAVPLAHAFEERLEALSDVTAAWDGVLASGIIELLASLSEAQLLWARRLLQELAECRRELERLQRIASGAEMAEAFAQTGINGAISAALLAITIVNPVVGIAVSIGAAGVQLGLDECLGPTQPDVLTYSASGTGLAGAGLERLAQDGSKLKAAGRRLGVVGAVAGTTLDVLETREAIQQYEAARGQIVAVSNRIRNISRDLHRLRPLLQYPDLARAMIDGMRQHAQVLRHQHQVVLREHDQL